MTARWSTPAKGCGCASWAASPTPHLAEPRQRHGHGGQHRTGPGGRGPGRRRAEVQRQLDSLANKQLVTNHDAFGYYIDRYGLHVVGSIIPSFDSTAELSGRDIRDLVARIKATGVKAVFSEASLPPRTAEAIGREAGVKVVAGRNALYGDSLGPRGSAGSTYLAMEEHNTKVIVDNLR